MRKLIGWFVFIALSIAAPAHAQTSSNSGLEIYVFNVGQADAMLIVGPGPARRTLLVDMGVGRGPYSGAVNARHVARRIRSITGRRHVDYFLLSHFHEDHLGDHNTGLAQLIDSEGITIGTAIDTGRVGVEFTRHLAPRSDRRSYHERNMARWLQSGLVRSRVLPTLGTGQIQLGAGVNVDIVAFGGQFARTEPSVHVTYAKANPDYFRRNEASENDLSIAFELSLGNFEFWTAGDLSGAHRDGTAARVNDYVNVEYPMVRHWTAANRESDVEVYRASHHGARFSSSVPFLAALDPETVIYSSLDHHGHPTREVVAERVLGHVRQYATGLDPDIWPGRPGEQPFSFYRGTVPQGALPGEVQIFVDRNGSRYTVNGSAFRSFSDAQERANADRGGSATIRRRTRRRN